MWPFFNFDKVFIDLAWAVKHNETAEQKKLIDYLIRNRRRSVPKLIETLKSSLFNADVWINEAQFAGDVLTVLSQDKRSQKTVIKALISVLSEPRGDFQVKPDWILKEIGVRV